MLHVMHVSIILLFNVHNNVSKFDRGTFFNNVDHPENMVKTYFLADSYAS